MSSLGLFEAEVGALVKGQPIQVQYDANKGCLCVLEKFKHPDSKQIRLNLHFFFLNQETPNPYNRASKSHVCLGLNFISESPKMYVDFSEAVISTAKISFNQQFDLAAIWLGKTLFGSFLLILVSTLDIKPNVPHKQDQVLVFKKVLASSINLAVSSFKWHPFCHNTLVILDQTAKFLYVLELVIEGLPSGLLSKSIEIPAYSISLNDVTRF